MTLVTPASTAVASFVVGVSMAGAGVYLLLGLGWALLIGSVLPLGLTAVLTRGLIRGS